MDSELLLGFVPLPWIIGCVEAFVAVFSWYVVEGEVLSLGEPPVIGSAVPVYKTYLELIYDLSR